MLPYKVTSPRERVWLRWVQRLKLHTSEGAREAMAESSLPFVYIPGDEVRELVSMSDMIEEISKGLQWVSAGAQGGVIQPVRSVVEVNKYSG